MEVRKVSTKIGVILSLIKKVDNLIIVGAMANNFIKYKGNKVGKSLMEENSEIILKKFIINLKKIIVKLLHQ